MKLKTQTYTFRWAAFDPGDYVTPTSPYCELPPGVYKVIEYKDPVIPFEQHGWVVVLANGHRFGLSTEYLTLSEPPQEEREEIICPHGLSNIQEKIRFQGGVFTCKCCQRSYGVFDFPIPELCETCGGPPKPKAIGCANCGEYIGYASTAAAPVKFGDFEFCDDLCHEQWLDALQDKNEQKYGDEAD